MKHTGLLKLIVLGGSIKVTVLEGMMDSQSNCGLRIYSSINLHKQP
jgi:hypothetical protein